MSVNNITVDAIEADINGKPQANENRVNAFDERNYLNIKLGPNETEKELIIRLLPIDSTVNTPFKRIHMHSIRLNEDQRAAMNGSEWKTYVCLEKEEDIDHETLGHKCPFCEKNREFFNKFKEAADPVEKEAYKQESLKWRPFEAGVIRCIERGKEDEGPKFWKFTIRQDGTDPMGQIKLAYNTARKESIADGDEPINILDIYNGTDLLVTIKAVFDKQGERTKKTSVSVTRFGKQKPLSKDPELIEKWVNDPKKWSDVFVPKPYECLSIVAEGHAPYFNKKTQKYEVYAKKELNDAIAVQEANDRIEKAKNAVNSVPSVGADADLPF